MFPSLQVNSAQPPKYQASINGVGALLARGREPYPDDSADLVDREAATGWASGGASTHDHCFVSLIEYNSATTGFQQISALLLWIGQYILWHLDSHRYDR
jgi:hypothetical protein